MSGAHAGLRAATRAEHERVDALFARLDLTDPADYGRFLSAHAAALPSVETALDAAGMARLLADWPGRRRGAALLQDLAALDLTVPAPLAAPPLPDAAACWGAAYVVEGSRLGGALLARQVGEGLPRGYLAAPQPRGAWRTFLSAMDTALGSDDQLADAVAAARATFALFETAGHRQLERVAG